MTHCQAWFHLKLLETIFGFVCVYIHMGIIDLPDETIPHKLYYCGTFYGFILLSVYGMISIYFGGRVPFIQMEALGNYFASSMHFMAAVLAMYDIEQDYHLCFLGNIEETYHTYLVHSLYQSLAALILGSLYLLHAMFATDVILVPIHDPDDDDDDEKYRVGLEVPPIQIFVFGKWVHNYLNNYYWYYRMGGKRGSTMTLCQVWFKFKFMEAVIGCFCIYQHMMGVFQKEPIPHNTYYCGTFVGWVLKSFHGMAGIYWNGRVPSVFMEALSCCVASLMHILAGYLAMHSLELDVHLMYISNDSEASHPFFIACKNQTFWSLGAGFVYLLHGLFASDVIWAPEVPILDESDPRQGEDAIRLYVLGRYMHTILDQYEWFRRMGGKEYARTGPSL